MKMSPNIICLGELLVEIMRTEKDIPHGTVGAYYKGPFPSGAPANFIDSASRMSKSQNLSTGFIGVVGNDEFGECILNKLKFDGVDTTRIRIDETRTTGIAFNQYNSDGSRKFIFAAGAAGQTDPDDIDRKYFSDVKALHIMGSALSISESSRDSCYKAMEVARSLNPQVIISFDPNLRPEMLNLKTIIEISKPVLERTTLLFPSGEEAEMLAGVSNTEQACKKLLELGSKIVVLKQGKDGCTIYSQEEKKAIKIHGFKTKEIDPTGAGDSFDGAFIIGYLAGWELEKIGKFANAVGALKVKHFGPMTNNTYEEVLKLMESA